MHNDDVLIVKLRKFLKEEKEKLEHFLCYEYIANMEDYKFNSGKLEELNVLTREFEATLSKLIEEN